MVCLGIYSKGAKNFGHRRKLNASDSGGGPRPSRSTSSSYVLDLLCTREDEDDLCFTLFTKYKTYTTSY